jgi:CheY-like chemotaxis protein
MQAFGEGITKISRISERNQESEDLTDIQGAQILLVEDNEINQQVALEILQGGGLNVTVANDGQEAVNAVKDFYYDAVLMDIQMPVMDGYAATRRIRKWEGGSRNAEVGPVVVPKEQDYAVARMRTRRRPVGRDYAVAKDGENGKNSDLKSQIPDPKSQIQEIPIIAMTAHAMAGDEARSIEAGMNDHITKPIDPDQLFSTMLKWIKPAEERTRAPKSLPASGGPPALDTPPEPNQAVSDDSELPESLPGFNLAAGLARLMGNKTLYRKLLLDFGANYGEVASEIREALAAGDFEQAHSLVHNLKGLAGNLEAKDLQATAVKIEALVKGQTAQTVSDKELNQKLAGLESALEQALDAVQTLGPMAEKKTINSTGAEMSSVPPELAQKFADRINAAAEMGDVSQIKSIAEELKAESDAMVPFCDELIRFAEDFDFEGIQKIVLDLDS